ncbi:MAG: hypothetical protein ACYTE3_22325 [Planctomycetota bacterium]
MNVSIKAISAFAFVAVLLVATVCPAMMVIYGEGKWPMDWPAELSPFRSQARTLDFASAYQETIYEIRFEKRENFEKLWPTILKLKSKGAPLRLSVTREPPQGQSELFVNGSEPMVRIYCPPYNTRSIRELGMASPTEPAWPESVRWRDGTLPEYAAKSYGGDDWVGVLEERPRDPWDWLLAVDEHPRGFRYRARIEIGLEIDGTVIDLNRIPLPADTPIIDRREPADTEKGPQNHTDWLREFLVRVESLRPGATRGELLKVFRAEGGQSTRSSRTYVYNDCKFVKVNVRFKPIDSGRFESPEDVITEISKPFVEWSILD